MADNEYTGRETGGTDLAAYVTMKALLAALQRAGIAMPYANLLEQAHLEAAQIAAGERPATDRVFVRVGRPWYVHCLRFCESQGIDPSIVCPDPTDK